MGELSQLCGAEKHAINGPGDRLTSGSCKQCNREAGAKYRTKRKAALDLVRALEARGVRVDPETLELREGGPGATTEVIAGRLVDRHGGDVE